MIYLCNYTILAKNTWTSTYAEDGLTGMRFTITPGTNKKLDKIYETLVFNFGYEVTKYSDFCETRIKQDEADDFPSFLH